jgi:formylglycine-generating enzyme required for sulfatase activity
MSELAATCDRLPVSEKDWSGFERCLILEMASIFLKDGDRDSLVTLFSTRLPSRYHFMDIEDLVVRCGTKLKDPVLVLGDAYAKCQVPEVRLQIAQAIRRGFKGSGIRGNDDAEFVKNAMQWYEREKDHLAFNPEYSYNRGQGDGYIKRPLFVRKPSAADNQPNESERDKTIPKAATVQAKPLKTGTNSIGAKMVLIPAGDFVMGSPENEKGHKRSEGPQHPVRITRPFWLGVYEVTQAEYESIMGRNPSLFSPNGGLAVRVTDLDTRRYPVENMSWYDAVEFCNRLSKKEGLPEYYRLSEARSKDLWKTVKVIGGQGYRLPTEAEWEYACRAGTTTAFSFGTVLKENQAHVSGKVSLERPTAVGSYPPNPFGLYDMHGNVAEFCNDGYDGKYYEDCPINDPPGSSDRHRVVQRGGQWCNDADLARSAHRGDEFPWVKLMFVGFRLARSLGETERIAPSH